MNRFYPLKPSWSPQCSLRVTEVTPPHTTVFSETPEGVHTKYSVNQQRVNECAGRASLSNMATLNTQQLHPNNCGKLHTCGGDWSEFSFSTFNFILHKQAKLTKCIQSVRIFYFT